MLADIREHEELAALQEPLRPSKAKRMLSRLSTFNRKTQQISFDDASSVASSSFSLRRHSAPAKASKERMPAVVIGGAIAGSLGAAIGAVIDGKRQQKEIEKIAAGIRHRQAASRDRWEGCGATMGMLEDPRDILARQQRPALTAEAQ